MKKIIMSEFKKNLDIKIFCIMILCFLSIIVGTTFMDEYKPNNNWKEEVIERQRIINEEMSSLKIQGMIESKNYKLLLNEYRLIKYSIDNNIPYATITPAIFAKVAITSNQVIFSLLIFIVVIGCIYLERDNKTWKNIFLCGIDKKKIFISKMVSFIMVIFSYVIVMYLIAYIVGIIFYPGVMNDYTIALKNNIVVRSNNLKVMFEECLMLCLLISFIVMILLVMYSFRIKKNTVILIAMIISLFGSKIDWLLQQVKMSKMMPFRYFYANDCQIGKALIMVVGYSVICSIISYKVFNNRRETLEL